MHSFMKLAVLESEVEAQLLEAILLQNDIPHRIRSYHDSAYDGVFQNIQGWGHVEGPEESRESIETALADLRSSAGGMP
ncbi:MAG: hypothetical protein KJ626_14455 [Verrucomicrobia bacterium]|nr:hypothetical protein [Verrucomicrobiota bacterium]